MHAARVVAGCANRLAAVEGAGEVQIGAARRAGARALIGLPASVGADGNPGELPHAPR